MGNKSDNYCPDIASPPGDTLLELLEDRGMTEKALAARIGCSEMTIQGVLAGECAISSQMAAQLETVLGVPASFWNALEANYRADLARISTMEKKMVSPAFTSMQGQPAIA